MNDLSTYFRKAETIAAEDPLKQPASAFASATSPALTEEMIQRAESTLGVKLPESLLDLLRVQNGGYLERSEFGWINEEDYVEIRALAGLGFDRAMDGKYGARYISEVWEYPAGLIHLDGDGHTGVFLDYRTCGPQGEPAVVWYDTEADHPEPQHVSATFADFLAALHEPLDS